MHQHLNISKQDSAIDKINTIIHIQSKARLRWWSINGKIKKYLLQLALGKNMKNHHKIITPQSVSLKI